MKDELADLPLGKATCYSNIYDASLLYPLARKTKRDEIGVDEKNLPFTGVDVWTAFEMSWLNHKGKPIVAIGEFEFPAESPRIIESKSFKLYLNSFNGTRFESQQKVIDTLQQDLSAASGAGVRVSIRSLNEMTDFSAPPGMCLDELDIAIDNFQLNPQSLSVSSSLVEETVFSNLLKSNCLVTGQPDWGTVVIHYRGPQIDHEGLLRYIISFREHMEFHEQCVERIFKDITDRCQPHKLEVYARYLRRGGLDINPYRSSEKSQYVKTRFIRQ